LSSPAAGGVDVMLHGPPAQRVRTPPIRPPAKRSRELEAVEATYGRRGVPLTILAKGCSSSLCGWGCGVTHAPSAARLDNRTPVRLPWAGGKFSQRLSAPTVHSVTRCPQAVSCGSSVRLWRRARAAHSSVGSSHSAFHRTLPLTSCDVVEGCGGEAEAGTQVVLVPVGPVDELCARWDSAHERYWGSRYRRRESRFARYVASRLLPSSRILELGAGSGQDAAYFHRLGHQVVGTDISRYAVARAMEDFAEPGIEFAWQDLREPLAFESGSFDAVYARLALHYFSDSMTRGIVSEVHRVLRPEGRFFFMCKSTEDPLYGVGEEVAPFTWSKDGEIRHFFDVDYVRRLLTDRYEFLPQRIVARSEGVYGSRSGVVLAFAERVGDYVQLRLPLFGDDELRHVPVLESAGAQA
jgi:SAM-dependent methyltransferase